MPGVVKKAVKATNGTQGRRRKVRRTGKSQIDAIKKVEKVSFREGGDQVLMSFLRNVLSELSQEAVSYARYADRITVQGKDAEAAISNVIGNSEYALKWNSAREKNFNALSRKTENEFNESLLIRPYFVKRVLKDKALGMRISPSTLNVLAHATTFLFRRLMKLTKNSKESKKLVRCTAADINNAVHANDMLKNIFGDGYVVNGGVARVKRETCLTKKAIKAAKEMGTNDRCKALKKPKRPRRK